MGVNSAGRLTPCQIAASPRHRAGELIQQRPRDRQARQLHARLADRIAARTFQVLDHDQVRHGSTGVAVRVRESTIGLSRSWR
jgi:hypothetical protein